MIEFKVKDSEVIGLIDGVVVYRGKQLKNSHPSYMEDVEESVANAFCARFPSELPVGLNMNWSPSQKTETIGGDLLRIFMTKETSSTELSITFKYQISEWNKSFNFFKFSGYLEERLEEHGFTVEELTIEYDVAFLSISVILEDEGIAQSQIEQVIDKYRKISEELASYLSNDDIKHHLLRVFNFPKGYQHICSQYLVWFGEFLESVGISALISVNQHSHGTEIVVSSEHTEQMFHQIEVLFTQYLSLPYAEFLPASNYEPSPEHQFILTQLQTQISHYKAQLEMKSASLQMKDTTIQSLQNQLLLLESMQGSEEVELLGGVVKIGEIEWGPIKISPKKLLDKTKQ